jgi:hypothetical protein
MNLPKERPLPELEEEADAREDMISLRPAAPAAGFGSLFAAGIGGLAAIGVLAFFVLDLRGSDEAVAPQPPPTETAAVAPAPQPSPEEPRQPDTTGGLTQPQVPPAPLPQAVPVPSPAMPAVAALPPPAAAPETAPVLNLPAEEIAALIAKGEDHLKAGDLAVARLYFERVADAGDPRGAAAMARSFDEAVLATLPVIGPAADPEAARAWSERAKSLEAAR